MHCLDATVGEKAFSTLGADLIFAAGSGRALREALNQGRGSLSSSYRLFI